MGLLIAGNWKMNGLGDRLGEVSAVAECARTTSGHNDVLICVPSTLITRAVEAGAGLVVIGGEDCGAGVSGAFTGDISAEMLKDAGASAVIVGHSERRRNHNETDAMVAAKAVAARRAGLAVIICIGETQAQRDEGAALSACSAQIAASLPVDLEFSEGSAIAYEPLWAIGTGRVPTAGEIVEVHQSIRQRLTDLMGGRNHGLRILYGGSVTAENAGSILELPQVDGVLVGGASLRSHDFNGIIRAADAVTRHSGDPLRRLRHAYETDR